MFSRHPHVLLSNEINQCDISRYRTASCMLPSTPTPPSWSLHHNKSFKSTTISPALIISIPPGDMTKRRRRTTQFLWLDTLRLSTAAKSLRRSEQATRENNNSTAGSVVRDIARSPQNDRASFHPDLDGSSNFRSEVQFASSSNPSSPAPIPLQESVISTPSPTYSHDHDMVDHTSAPIMPTPEVRGEAASSPDADETGERYDTEQNRSVARDEEEDSEQEGNFQPFERYEGQLTEPDGQHPIPSTHLVGLCPAPMLTSPSAHGYHSGTVEDHNGTNTPDNHHIVDADTDPDILDVGALVKHLQRHLQIWSGKLNLTALVAVVGSVRYTVQQYNYARDMLSDAGASPTWPCYATTHRHFRNIIETCLPDSKLVQLSRSSFVIRSTQNGEESTSDSEEESPELESTDSTRTASSARLGTEKVRIFLPSSWAKLDVATSVVFNDMFPCYYDVQKSPRALDLSEIIRDRASFASSCDHIFVNSGGRHVRCGPRSDIEVSVTGQKPSFQTAFSISATEDNYVLQASIVATWSVGSLQNSRCSAVRASKIQSLSSQQRIIITSLPKAAAPDQGSDVDMYGPIPGDLCTLLSSGNVSHGDHFAVIIHRFWKYEDGIPSVTLLWVYLPPPTTSEPATEEQSALQMLESHVADGVTVIRSHNGNPTNPEQGVSRQAGSSSYGTLVDGIPFVIYRILLYCDDFQKSSAMYPKGSAGGCYFLPLSLPPEGRRNTSSVRIVSLTPLGVSTNQVIHYIVDDPVHASVHGVEGRTPSGQKVKIFIDVVGFVGDYPASASVVDVVGHVCGAPCTLCTFRRLQDAGTQGWRFGYTTEVDASNSAFMRHGERHHSLRESQISDEDANALGMVAKEKYSDTTCPLLHLQRARQSKKSRSALANDGRPVVSSRFDAVRCNLVAPDHLLTAVAKDILNATVKTLPSKDLRMKTDTYICAALRENGLLRQKQVFNLKKKVLHSMTLSELFCVLLVSVPILRIIARQCNPEHAIKDCFKLLLRLQRLIALTYWWPVHDLDGENAVALVHGDKESYFSDLKAMSKRYVQEVDNICGESEQIKEHLDQPNLHRLIELSEHTIPAFGHVREFMELVFGSAHQPLKRCISRSNNHDAHIFAVEHCVGNDWQGRMAALRRNLSHEEEATKAEARRGIRRLLLGEQADLLDEEKHNELLATIDPILHNVFTPALQKQFEKDNMISNFAIRKTSVWKARVKIKAKDVGAYLDISMSDAQAMINESTRWIDTLYPAITQNGDLDQGDFVISSFRKARRVRIAENGRQIGKPSGHDTISANCCVQIYLDPSKVTSMLLTSTPGATQARPFFFAILAVLQRKQETPFALCFKCTKREDCIQRDEYIDDRSFQLLRLSPDIRRVALYHICDKDTEGDGVCKWAPQTGDVSHTKSLLQRGRFYFQTRVHGYPPYRVT